MIEEFKTKLLVRKTLFNTIRDSKPPTNDVDTILHYASTDAIMNEMIDYIDNTIQIIENNDNDVSIEFIINSNERLLFMTESALDILRNILIDRGYSENEIDNLV